MSEELIDELETLANALSDETTSDLLERAADKISALEAENAALKSDLNDARTGWEDAVNVNREAGGELKGEWWRSDVNPNVGGEVLAEGVVGESSLTKFHDGGISFSVWRIGQCGNAPNIPVSIIKREVK